MKEFQFIDNEKENDVIYPEDLNRFNDKLMILSSRCYSNGYAHHFTLKYDHISSVFSWVGSLKLNNNALDINGVSKFKTPIEAIRCIKEHALTRDNFSIELRIFRLK